MNKSFDVDYAVGFPRHIVGEMPLVSLVLQLALTEVILMSAISMRRW